MHFFAWCEGTCQNGNKLLGKRIQPSVSHEIPAVILIL